MVVLDDDPTGIQTVHGCLLITQWDEDSVREAFADSVPFFYILTNTRAMTRTDAARVTREAMEMVVKVNADYGYRLIIVSRSDSCLRGHFPLETDVMREVLTEHGIPVIDKTPFCPAFIEAGRVTIDGIHFMRDGERLVPVSETEFARDNVFAYHTSVLADYIREKGADPADYVIVNAQGYDELRAFAGSVISGGLSGETAENNRSAESNRSAACNTDAACNSSAACVVIRSSSSLPKAIAGIADQPLLDKRNLKMDEGGEMAAAHRSPVYIVGSHVKKTTEQLDCLLQEEGTCGLEVDVERILDDPEALMLETLTTLQQIVDERLTPVVYTSRREVRLTDADQRQLLGQRVSDFLVDIVARLPFTPAYLVGKGGITSHDILTRGLGVRSARVLGQVVNSVPCVMTSRFPYIIFPGNVGNAESLRDVYRKLR